MPQSCPDFTGPKLNMSTFSWRPSTLSSVQLQRRRASGGAVDSKKDADTVSREESGHGWMTVSRVVDVIQIFRGKARVEGDCFFRRFVVWQQWGCFFLCAVSEGGLKLYFISSICILLAKNMRFCVCVCLCVF